MASRPMHILKALRDEPHWLDAENPVHDLDKGEERTGHTGSGTGLMTPRASAAEWALRPPQCIPAAACIGGGLVCPADNATA